jgi:hypothetical protein
MDILMEGTDAKQSKIQSNFHKSWQFEKANQLTFTPGLKQVKRFLEGDEKVSMSTYAQSKCQPNPRQKRLFGCLVIEKSKSQNRNSWVYVA